MRIVTSCTRLNRQRMERIENVKKIGVLRANGIGDFIVSLPAIDALRHSYPDAEIVLFGKQWHADFLIKGRSSVDRVIVLPPSFFKAKEEYVDHYGKEMECFFEKMKAEQFDMALHFHAEDIFSNIFLNALEARVTVGHQKEGAPSLNKTAPYFYYQNEVFRYLELVRMVGAMSQNIQPKIRVLEEEKKVALQIREELSLCSPFIILHTGATDFRRQWPLEKFAELGRCFLEKGFSLFLSGSPDEAGILMELKNQLNSSEVCIKSDLPLGHWAALSQEAELLISNDTGPLHLARAAGCPTVGIFWGPNVVNWAPVYREKDGLAISWELHCPQCGTLPIDPYPFEPKTSFCTHQSSFVSIVSVEEVIKECIRILERKKDKAVRNHFSSIPN